MNPGRRYAAAWAAVVMLAVASWSASANELSVSEHDFRITWMSVVMRDPIDEAACRLTLEGSFHGLTFAKAQRNLIGYITVARIGTCTSNRIYALNHQELLNGGLTMQTLPWHFQYESFSGTLPRITGVEVSIAGAAFLVEILREITCLYKSEANAPWSGIFGVSEEGRITGFRSNESKAIPLFSGLACSSSMRIINSASVDNGEFGLRSIFLRLI